MRGGKKAARLVVLVVVAGGVLAGCGAPGGADGNLTDDWVAVAEPKPFTPPPAVCHEDGFDGGDTESFRLFRPVDCAQPHGAETFYVGAFSGAAAQRSSAPPETSSARRTAYADCDRRAAVFLGKDWRHGNLVLRLVVPTWQAWDGGARWYRCDLALADVLPMLGSFWDGSNPEKRSGSLKGALTAASDLDLGCYQFTDGKTDAEDAAKPTPCTAPHNTEFVGVYQAGNGNYPDSDADWERMWRRCYDVIARYVGVPADGRMAYRSGAIANTGAEDGWTRGDRGVRCFVWLNQRTVTRSLKGAGNKGLPVD